MVRAQVFISKILVFAAVFTGAVTAFAATAYDLNERILPIVLADAPATQEITINDNGKFAAYPVAGHSKSEALVHDAFAIIYSTQAAQETIKPRILNADQASQAAFGGDEIDDKHSFPIMELHNGLGVPFDILNRLFNVQTNSYGQFGTAIGDYQVREKTYVFLVQEPGARDPYFDSYTTEENRTFMVLTPNTTRLDLIKWLAHEIAISGDEKYFLNQFIYSVNSDTWSIDEARAKIPPVFAKSSVNRVFQIVRALNFEKQVLTELLSTEALAPALTGEEAQLYQTDFENEKQCRAFARAIAARMVADGLPQDAFDQLDDLEKAKTKLQNKSVSSCLLASVPYIRSHGYKTSGPRPRVGDWNARTAQLPAISMDQRMDPKLWIAPPPTSQVLNVLPNGDKTVTGRQIRQILDQQIQQLISPEIRK